MFNVAQGKNVQLLDWEVIIFTLITSFRFSCFFQIYPLFFSRKYGHYTQLHSTGSCTEQGVRLDSLKVPFNSITPNLNLLIKIHCPQDLQAECRCTFLQSPLDLKETWFGQIIVVFVEIDDINQALLLLLPVNLLVRNPQFFFSLPQQHFKIGSPDL